MILTSKGNNLFSSFGLNKARPIKPSNGVEDKTKPTISIRFDRINLSQKLWFIAKAGSILKVYAQH